VAWGSVPTLPESQVIEPAAENAVQQPQPCVAAKDMRLLIGPLRPHIRCQRRKVLEHLERGCCAVGGGLHHGLTDLHQRFREALAGFILDEQREDLVVPA
jgi:hypothetical protein